MSIHTEDYRGYQIVINQDDYPESPREWDNLGTMLCCHRNYNLGDKQSNAEEIKEVLADKNNICLPLYLYDHSGITMNTTGFSCQWDSGQVGIIYIDKEKIRKEFSVKRVNKKLIDRIKGYLVNEVKTYDDYLTGNCYWYEINKNDEQIDSCGGYFGDYQEGALIEAKAVIDGIFKHAKELVSQHVIGSNPDKIYDVLSIKVLSEQTFVESQLELGIA